jgi:hypothetical protein
MKKPTWRDRAEILFPDYPWLVESIDSILDRHENDCKEFVDRLRSAVLMAEELTEEGWKLMVSRNAVIGIGYYWTHQKGGWVGGKPHIMFEYATEQTATLQCRRYLKQTE